MKLKKHALLLLTILSIFFACSDPDIEFNSPPELTLSPDLMVKTGDTLSSNCLWVKAVDEENDPLTYQWLIVADDSLQPGIIIQGAIDTFYIPDKSKEGVVRYFVAVSDGHTEVGSNFITVTVCDTCGI